MCDTETLDLHLINLKKGEATSVGTKVVRYLVKRLHEAHDNPALSTMVRALLLQDQVMMSVADDAVDHAITSKNPKGGDPGKKQGERERTPPRRRSLHPEDRSPKRQRSESTLSQSGRSHKGHFHRSRGRKSQLHPDEAKPKDGKQTQ